MADSPKEYPATKPVFVVELIPVASVNDPMRAIQALLKRALRDHGLRCRSLKTRPFVPGSGGNGGG